MLCLIPWYKIIKKPFGACIFQNHFHSLHFQNFIHDKDLTCWLYMQQLKQVRENYQKYLLNVNLSSPFAPWWSNHCVRSIHIWSFPGPYFSAFGLNTKRHGVSLHIQSKCGKLWTRKYPNTGTFHAVILNILLQYPYIFDFNHLKNTTRIQTDSIFAYNFSSFFYFSQFVHAACIRHILYWWFRCWLYQPFLPPSSFPLLIAPFKHSRFLCCSMPFFILSTISAKNWLLLF